MKSLGMKRRNKKPSDSPPAVLAPAVPNPASKPLGAHYCPSTTRSSLEELGATSTRSSGYRNPWEGAGSSRSAFPEEAGASRRSRRAAGVNCTNPSCPGHNSPSYSKAANSRDSRSPWKGWGGKSLVSAGARWVVDTLRVVTHERPSCREKSSPSPHAPSARPGLSPSGCSAPGSHTRPDSHFKFLQSLAVSWFQ